MKPGLRRILHWLFFTVAALTTLAVLFYAEEDWRGARAWSAVRRDLQARGESVEARNLIPPPIPDDQNLAMAPFFQRLFQYKVDLRTHVLTFNHDSDWTDNDTYKQVYAMPWGKGKADSKHPIFPDWMSGHASDLVALQRYYRLQPEFPHGDRPQAPADDVLLALTRFAPILDEVAREAAERSQTRFPVNWTQRPAGGITLPHYNVIRILLTTLRTRAVAELAAGQAPAARRDIFLALRLRQGMEHDPTLIASLVDGLCLSTLTQAIWEGLAAQRWSADDLDALQDGLRRINLLQEYQDSMRGERALMLAQLPEDLQNAGEAREIANTPPVMMGVEIGSAWFSPKRWLWKSLPYWPCGWYAQNAAIGSRYLQQYWIDTVDPGSHRVLLAKFKGADQAVKNLPVTAETLLARISLLGYTSIAKKFAQFQTIIDQAVTACALEKYYLGHHAYPTTLAALVPGYLDRVPNDVIDGAPMRYRLTVDGRYQLYSIGWDGRDGGGAIDWPPDRKWRRTGSGSPAEKEPPFPSPSRDQSDWVWQYAPAEPPEPPDNQSRLESLH